MPSTISSRQYELLAPLASCDAWTEHLARPHFAAREDHLVRLWIGRLGTEFADAPEVGSRVHSHVLRVIDTGRHDGVDYVAYEHVEGVPLSDIARRGVMRRRPECAVAVVLDALRAEHAYRSWLAEYARDVMAERRPITCDDVWVGVDGSIHLSVVDLVASARRPATASTATHVDDVGGIGAALLSLLSGHADFEIPSRAHARGAKTPCLSPLEAVAARAMGRSATTRFLSSEAMSLEPHRAAVREGLLAPAQAVSVMVCTTFPERLAEQQPMVFQRREDDDEPTLVGVAPESLIELAEEGHDARFIRRRSSRPRASSRTASPREQRLRAVPPLLRWHQRVPRSRRTQSKSRLRPTHRRARSPAHHAES